MQYTTLSCCFTAAGEVVKQATHYVIASLWNGAWRCHNRVGMQNMSSWATYTIWHHLLAGPQPVLYRGGIGCASRSFSAAAADEKLLEQLRNCVKRGKYFLAIIFRRSQSNHSSSFLCHNSQLQAMDSLHAMPYMYSIVTWYLWVHLVGLTEPLKPSQLQA